LAVHNLGYRGWSGHRRPDWTRFLIVTSAGVRRAWQSRWLRRMLLLAWLPAVWFGVGFFAWEQSLLNSQWRDALLLFVRDMPRSGPLADVLDNYDLREPAAARHAVWAWLLQSFFRYPQGLLMVLVIGLIAPPLISQDIRSRAFLLYFSRPLTRLEYILGKVATICVYLLLISTLPALALYVLGVLLSPQLSVVQATWDLPLRILAASAVLIVPTASLALCLSSLTQESRYAGFAWFTIWILGWFTYGVMVSVETLGARTPADAPPTHWSHVSLYHTLGRVQSWLFGFGQFRDIVVPGLILLVITAVSLVVLWQRVAAPMRV
jgi:ABC-type transport system involved in multi-copper enzyme maturation permease subunit